MLASIKRRGFIPAGSGLSNDDILQYASEELRSYIPAFLKSIREEYIIASLDLTVSNGTVAAPARAVGAALRTIGWVLGDGRVGFLNRIEPENAGGFSGQTGQPCGYMFQGNNILLLPAPTSGTLRLAYQQRPGQLVLPAACAEITGQEDGTTWDVASNPDNLAIGTLCDIVGSAPNFALKAMDQTVLTNDSGHLEINANLSTVNWAVGDFVCSAGETCIAQVPTEVHDLLAQAAAYKIAQATGSERAPAIKAGLDDLNTQMKMILAPRADGSARVIVSKSRIGRWNMGW